MRVYTLKYIKLCTCDQRRSILKFRNQLKHANMQMLIKKQPEPFSFQSKQTSLLSAEVVRTSDKQMHAVNSNESND